MISTATRRAARRLRNVARRTVQRLRDSGRSSYGDPGESWGPLARLVPAGISFAPAAADRRAARYFLDHRFDVLGSGWVTVRHGMVTRGFEGARFHSGAGSAAADLDMVNRANRAAARRIRQAVSAAYRPIDWHVDVKSGFRWPERAWYRDVRYGRVEGADVKVPWELSRMQHLPELALEYSVSRDERVPREFSDQILDWLASNPPRFGPNWTSTLEVGIRVANWLVAFDLFRAAGATFDGAFLRFFEHAVLDHAAHIAGNLEWSETLRANHYLGNVVGLLFAAAYLPSTVQTDAWLAFALQELMVETDRQFAPDGGHFEASTGYHRFCGEMIAVAAGWISALPIERARAVCEVEASAMTHGPMLSRHIGRELRRNLSDTGTLLSAAFYARLAAAAALELDITRPDGDTPQIGDNDSGRFLRLGGWAHEGTVAECKERYWNLDGFDDLPADAPYPVQLPASFRQWTVWAQAALGRSDSAAVRPECMTAHTLATALVQAPQMRADTTHGSARELAAPAAAQTQGVRAGYAKHERRGTYGVAGASLLEGLEHLSYPDFGVFIFRSPRLHLVIRCGGAGRDEAAAHTHEDQLSFDLVVDGRHAAADPGTYVYTGSPDWRRRYRSAHAHYAPAVEGPPPRKDALFSRPAYGTAGEAVGFGGARFVGRAAVPGGTVRRTIEVRANGIDVVDDYELAPPHVPAADDPLRPARQVPYSPGYGVRLRR